MTRFLTGRQFCGQGVFLAVICLALSGVQARPVVAQDAVSQNGATRKADPSEDALLARAYAGLAGTWLGSLQYRDYQSDRLEKIPIRMTVEALPVPRAFAHGVVWTDPGFLVHAHHVTQLPMTAGGAVRDFFLRDGQSELHDRTLAGLTWTDRENWRFTLEERGEDDGRPAHIRLTYTREGQCLRVEKTVRLQDGDAWDFRNRQALCRLPGP